MRDNVKSSPIEQRMVAIEEWMMHTDHLLRQLHDVLCTVQRRLDEQDATLNRWAEWMDRARVADERRTLEDDRPPHH